MFKNKRSFLKLKRIVLAHARVIRIFILIAILSLFGFLFFTVYRLVAGSVVGTATSAFVDFVSPSSSHIQLDNGRVNVLLLGIGGANHDGPDLTDTMLFLSLNPTSKKMTMISIPRDIWIPELRDKINSAYMYGKQKTGVSGGLALARSTVANILGVKIPYAVLIDFNGFKDVVDAISGIQVDVKEGFTDNMYPITGRENDNCNGDLTYACRYMTVTFHAGLQNMNGDRALEFVRSRHASGVEGNDIAREARQELVISAIVKKILNPSTFVNLNTDKKLLDVASSDVKTNLNITESATLARFLVDAKNNIKSYTIPDNLLYNPPNQYKYFGPAFTHAFVFIPAASNGKWIDVQSFVDSVLP